MNGKRAIIAIALLGLALTACDPAGPTTDDSGLVLDLSGLADAEAVDSVRVRITAGDIAEEIWAELEIDGNSASGVVDCPAGYNRLVEVDVAEAGVILYTAAGRADVEEGQITTLSLTAHSVDDPNLSVAGRLGAFGDYNWQHLLPTDLSLSDTGEVFVVDPEAGELTAYHADGVLDYSVGFSGQSDYSPATVLWLPGRDALLVADPINDRLDLFDAADGAHLENWNQPDGFGEPGDLAYWPQLDAVLIIDVTNGELFVLDNDGAFLDSFSLDDGDGPLDNPVGLALLESDSDSVFIAVSDALAGEVYLFDCFYGSGHEPAGTIGGGLQQPLGLCRADDLLVVTDATQSQLVLYDYLDYSVDYLADYGEQGERLGAFTLPAAAAYHDGRLWVADGGNHRLQYFDMVP